MCQGGRSVLVVIGHVNMAVQCRIYHSNIELVGEKRYKKQHTITLVSNNAYKSQIYLWDPI